MIELDDKDIIILNTLKNNSRTTYAELSEQLNISRVAVRERIKKLVKMGVIEKFTVIVNGRKLGKEISAFFEVEVEPRLLEEVAKEISQDDNVAIVYEMTGPNVLHVHAFLKDHNELREYVKDKLFSIKGVKRVESRILLKRYKSDLSIRI
jgi:DNA-binding Lrp family transcriptional regulator